MDKKNYILKALDLLKDKRNLARAWIIIINQIDVDESILDLIIKTIDTSINQFKDEEDKIKLNKLKSYLAKVKEAEHISQTEDKASLDELDKLLTTL